MHRPADLCFGKHRDARECLSDGFITIELVIALLALGVIVVYLAVRISRIGQEEARQRGRRSSKRSGRRR